MVLNPSTSKASSRGPAGELPPSWRGLPKVIQDSVLLGYWQCALNISKRIDNRANKKAGH